MSERRIIISGGGTAGHIFPALAVGQKLKEKDPDLRLIYVGGRRALEKTIMQHHQAEFLSLNIEGLKGQGFKIIKSLFLLPFSFLKSLFILLRLKPQLVIGVGGYSSGPIVLLASWLKKPTLIMEQNLNPGFTNKLLIPWVRKAVVAFAGSLPSFKGKGILIGNPVREEFHSLTSRERNSKLSILVFGGSQGSHFLNKSLVASLPFLKDKKEHLRIFHQTGKKDLEWVKENYEESSFKDVVVEPFFFDMPRHFQKSDIVISRAGATTIAELIASQKASMLIPFSKATDNHQVFNARELERIQAAEVILEEEFNPEFFASRIMGFVDDREKIQTMEKNLEPLKTEDVAEKIASLCLEVMEPGQKE